MKKTALLFTGQGSQISGMGQDFAEKYSVSKNIFDCFDETLNKKISELCFSGSDEELTITTNTQPCILAVEIAILEAIKQETNLQFDYVAGHSLGEYAALYAANVINTEEAAKLIQARANAMNKVSVGAMSAIIGLDEKTIKETLNIASEFGYVDIANYNTPEQIVITGEKEAVEKANELLIQNGAKRAIPLAVAGAFHSKLMESASVEFMNTTKQATLSNATIPVITNIDANETILADDFREKMPKQICSSVKWVQTLNYLANVGVNNFIEIGPKKILTGMVRKTLNDVSCNGISTISDLEKFAEEYKTIGV